MKRRLLSLFLAFVTMLSLLPTAAFAASSEEEALGEVDIYNGDYELGYLAINGSVRKQIYTYFLYEANDGTQKESPAYCVTPNQYGVPQTVGPGESIKYLADEKASDPKVVGIISNGYPHRSLGELKLDNKYQAYYATKMALWCYLLPNWDIANLKVAPGLSGSELDIGNRILAAAKDIYKRGTTYNYMLTPRMTVTADKSTAYPVTIGGQAYLQQVFTVWSETWVYDYDVAVAFSDPDSVPEGAKIVDTNNKEITAVTTKYTSDGYAGTFKVLYPAGSVEGQSGNVQFSLSAPVAQYAAMYAVCQEKDQYGDLQNYICDLDNKVQLDVAAVSSYADSGEPDPDETALKIVKLEEGTEIPLEGAVFSVYDPEGKKVGSYSTGPDGTVTIPLTLEGHYTVTEEIPPRYHLLPEETTQHADVEYDKTATLTFWNAPYGSLRVEKRSDTGDALSGVTIQIKHIETGETRTGQTRNGVIVFDELAPGGWEVRELAGIDGWVADTDTVQTVAVVTGQESTATIINKELPGLRITKYERGTMTLMPNVSFEIFRDAESLGIFTTDEFGQILLTNCEPGTYRAEERDTGGDGHVLDTTPQEVELKAGDGIKDLVFFNDRLPGIHLIKVDSSDLSKPIANARFRIEAVDGSWGPEEYTTSEDGAIDLSKLPVGTYVVTELECPGYIVDDAQRIIHLDGGEQAQFVFTNSKLPSLHLYKESADGTPLGGVTYRLARIEDGSRYLDRTTGPDGSICWEGLEPGVYFLQEVSTVSDHILDPTEYHVELFPGKDATICLQNDKRPNLTIHKSDADTGAPVPGTVFLVKGADGHSVAEVTTGQDGSATVENLLPGVYEVSEKSVPSPYLLDADPQLVTLYPNRDRDVYFENHKRPTVTIQKENSVTHDPIQYAEFHITWSSNKTETGEQRDLGTFQTDEAGQIVLEGIEDGWLTIKETKPAPGYQLPEDPVTEVYVKGGENKTVTISNIPLSALVVYKQDSVTGAGISGCRFQLKYLGGEVSGSGGTVVGTYVYIDDLTESGRYYLRELENEGYVPDTELKTVYVKSGRTTEITWENRPITGQIQIVKKSADYNPTTGLPAGTLLEGAIFEIYDKTGNLVDTIRSDSRGLAVSKPLPLSRYTIREVKAPEHYGVNETELTAYLEHEGQIVRFEVTNKSLSTGVSISKTGPKEVVSGQPVRYTFSRIANTSNVRLDSFYWRDTIPAQVRLDTVVTGTYNFPGTYKITYRVNGGEYRTLSDNLSTSKNYTLTASAAALGLAANERVTEVMFVFGQAPAGFAQVETPYLNCTAVANLPTNSSFVNIADVGGVYNGTWVQAISRWVTTVYGKPDPLPRTGY